MTQTLATRPVGEVSAPRSNGKMPLRVIMATIRENSEQGLATAVEAKRGVSVRSWNSLRENHNGHTLRQRKDHDNPDIMWMWLD